MTLACSLVAALGLAWAVAVPWLHLLAWRRLRRLERHDARVQAAIHAIAADLEHITNTLEQSRGRR